MGENKFKSVLGFLLSTACIIMILVTSLLFGKDFYMKVNPRVVTENILTDIYKEIDLTPKDLNFAYRIEDSLGNPINKNLTKMLNIRLFYISVTYNKTSQEYNDESYQVKIVPCNSTLVPDEKFNSNRNLTEWTCLDFPSDGFKFGGSWSGDFVHYFSMSISNCDDNGKCVNMNEVRDYFTENLFYFSMFYPIYYFLPNSLDSPQNIKYHNYYTTLSYSLSKTDRIYFKSYLLDDDKGWIFKDTQSSSVIAFDTFSREFEPNIIQGKENDRYSYYNLVMYYNSDYDKLYRSYMKIQELAALDGNIMKIIIIIIKLVRHLYNF